MTCLEWSRQLQALRDGKLRLVAPGEDGMSEYARGHFDDLIEYLKAVENGYRVVCKELDNYRKHERTSSVKCGRKTVGELIANQWSDEAALGYAWMAAVQIALAPDKTVMLLEAMGDEMKRYDRAYAEKMHRRLIDDGGHAYGG